MRPTAAMVSQLYESVMTSSALFLRPPLPYCSVATVGQRTVRGIKTRTI